MDYLASLADSFGEVDEEEVAHSEPEDDGPVIPPFYQPLYQATEAVAVGDLEMEEWLAIWSQVGLTLERMVEQITAQVERVEATLGQETRVAGALLLQGLENALEALQVMGDFVDDQNPEHLNQGWGDLMDASDIVARATHEFQRLRNQIKPS
jgi:hypothetical protein